MEIESETRMILIQIILRYVTWHWYRFSERFKNRLVFRSCLPRSKLSLPEGDLPRLHTGQRTLPLRRPGRPGIYKAVLRIRDPVPF